MSTRVYLALCACLLTAAPAGAITVRFDTNVGNIDLLLNPTDNPNLQNHVENILQYIEAGRYDRVVLNRAADASTATTSDDFVLQFGGFALSAQQFSSFNAFTPVEAFAPVVVDNNNDGVVDFDTTELRNLRGTVSLALSNSPNTGTSSFFVNINDNSVGNTTNLDAGDFVPFARVVDMSTVDYIMRLPQVSDPSAGLASSDIPVVNDDNLLVYVEQAYCVDCDGTETMAVMAEALVADDSFAASNLDGAASSSASQVAAVPEPPALVLAVGAFMVLAILKGPRR